MLSLAIQNNIHFENVIISNGKHFKQKDGITMGGACSPLVANLYLHMFEYEKIDDLNYIIFRYIEDIICCFKDDKNDVFPDFYPTNFELIKIGETNNDSYATFLDLAISINGRVETRIYDKRNDYSFTKIFFSHIIPTCTKKCSKIFLLDL